MRPTVALRKEENGGFREVEIEDIVVGDVVLVRPNEIISVDGIIVHGETAIDTSNITGEFLAKDSYIGDQVYSGTKNLSGAIEVKVTTPSNETTISKLIRYVKEASKKKAPVVKVADKMASYLVIGALLISIVVFFTSLFGFKLSPLESVQRAATILVVFCPCALALATPVAIAAGIGNASKNGILIKSGLALEKITKIDTIAFDKTGTITEGKINVEKVYPYEISEKELIIYAASAENKSEHPIAKAILKYNNYDILESTKTVSLLGIGVEAKIGDKKVGVYKIDHVKDLIPIIEYEKIEKLGHTVVSVLLDGKYIGSITLSDTLRADAEWTIKELKDMNKECVMLTGDNLESALMIAEKVGIDNVKANLLPEDKVSIIEELKRDNKKALMVGDGVNDAAALAVADSSIAIAAMESSVAMETAEISLMTKNIKKIPYLFSLSKRTLLTIKINITLSLLISITSIILSALGLINIVAGALIHNASSVLVTLHSALLLMYKRKSHLA
jgi:heavy metal translocating P-type ATPase